MRPRSVDDSRKATVRQRLRAVLRDGPATARDLSRLVGIPEHDVPEALAYVERTARGMGERLVVRPSVCRSCGFSFHDRDPHRFSRPGRCRKCRGRRITLPEFFIER